MIRGASPVWSIAVSVLFVAAVLGALIYFDTHEQVIDHALATAREIASKAPLAVTGSKVMINYARDHTIKDGLDYIAVWQTAMFSGPHMAEGPP